MRRESQAGTAMRLPENWVPGLVAIALLLAAIALGGVIAPVP
jgi:hypothetical protein